MLRLASELRGAILAGNYAAYRDEFLARYTPASEKVREEQREKWKKAARLQQSSSRLHDQS
jgi:queuine tRNA-ribosyltransferase